jgi:hypothetical protein
MEDILQQNHLPLQWNQMQGVPSQVSSTSQISGFQNSGTMNELLKEENWDDISRMIEYMNDSSVFYDPRLYLN